MLLVFPHPARRDAEIANEGSAFLDDRCTLGELVRAVGAEALPGRRAIDRVAARRVLREVVRAEEAAAGPFGAIAHTQGFVTALARTFAAVAEADVAPAELAFATVELASAAARERVQAIGRLMDAYTRALEVRRLADAPALLAAAVRRLEGGGALPERWRRAAAGGVLAVDVLDLSPARARLLRALGARLALPHDAARPELFAYVAPVLAAGAGGYDPVGPAAAQSLAPFLRRLFRSGAPGAPGPDPGPDLRITAAARSADEPRAVAARVRTLLEAGAAPDAIAVAVAGLDQQADRLRSALERYGVPVAERRGAALASAPPAMLLLDLYRAARAGFPREALIAVCTSRYLDQARAPDGGFVGHHVPALLRASGAKDDRRAGWGAELATHLDRLAMRPPRPGADPPDLGRERAAAAHVASLVERLRPLGRPGPAARLLGLLRDAVEWVGLRRRATLPWGGGVAEEPLLARDQAALEAALGLLEDIGRSLGDVVLPPEALAAHVEDAFAATTLRPIGVRGGAVSLVDVRELGGCPYDHVILVSLQDGRFPARGGGDPLLPDSDRAALNRALGRDALRLDHRTASRAKRAAQATAPGAAADCASDWRALASGEVGPRALGAPGALPPREELDALVFFLAVAAARRTLDLVYARADDAGRSLLRSPFVDEVVRAHPRGDDVVVSLPISPVPTAEDAARPDELRARVALEGGRTADGAAPPAGTEAALALAHIERARERFFLGRPSAEAAPFVGILGNGGQGAAGDDAAAARAGDGQAAPGLAGPAARLLRDHVADRPEAPGWSAGRITDFARCAFRYFAHRVLRLERASDTGDDLDPLSRGKLLHRVMEEAMRALDGAGLLPLPAQGDALERALAVALGAAEASLARWEATELSGHPGLWALQRESALETLEALLRLEADAPLFAASAPLRPAGFEVSFGAEEGDVFPALALPSPDGTEAVHVRGRIDRLDRTSDGKAAGIVDYKSGAYAPLSRSVRAEELGHGEFQLPVYLLVLAGSGARDLHALYLSLRDRKKTKDVAAVLGAEGVQALVEVEPARRAALRGEAEAAMATGGGPAPANVADGVWRMIERIRGGDFAVQPRTCEFCDYAGACRVQLHARGEGD